MSYIGNLIQQHQVPIRVEVRDGPRTQNHVVGLESFVNNLAASESA